ncbi:hypothetical protein QN382_19320 [Pseudomonas sp. 10B1]|uniref:hypothetical protein n=1 Tax=unclassified Pseudomonas TaxID=196821 RepID=UPI002B2344CC|nr:MULTISPECIES: hypothetical protein [unclassified Pseudomonas]MEA9994896.1 hypothetical protein [Pseudomonas sp. AA4]MEB0088347.1 hypothetical protein [Pseudomonas sp. RTI1]MEB0127158.1 hypothetical protein [Pseudomonas sp. CCC1.2]MEB0152913.1 hypothetical protein [Pseudomonas sp. CCC4.3]MEB0219439.1 hypothetical protein [Pseudomonas sp. AB12(2023)]
MRGLIISNPRLEFLRPALECWFDCIDRYSQVMGEGECTHWFDERTNLGMLSSAAWMAQMVTLEHAPSKKQQDDGNRSARTGLFVATSDDSAYIQATQRWPYFGEINLTPALLDIVGDAKKTSYANHLKLGGLFVTPRKIMQSVTVEELEDFVEDLQKQNACAVVWYFPYGYRNLHNQEGQYFPGLALLLRAA